jgi:MFS family permease
MTSITPDPEPAPDQAGGIAGFFSKFTVLKSAMRELWLSLAIKLLVYAAYGLMNSTIALWLMSDFGYSEKKALALVAFWSLLMTICTLLVGSLTDAIGLRATFFLGVGFCIVSRAVMAFTSASWLALAGGLVPLAIGEALTSPVLIAAIRQYSTTKQRSISFSMIYSMANVGFLIASLLFDFVRRHLGEHGHLNLPGARLSTYQTLLLVSCLIEFMILPLIFFLREGAEATDQGVQFNPKQSTHRHQPLLTGFVLTIRDAARDTIRIFGSLLKEAGIYRFLIFLMLIAFLKLIFMQMYYVYPAFGIRVLGDGAPVGTLWAINSICAILLVPVVGALTQKYSAYKMVTVGAVISALSVFIMALPSAWFEPLANGFFGQWLGHSWLGLKGGVHPYYVMIAIFVVLLSVGEAFYSPRVYEYAAAIAPKGQEASYGALSYIPFLLSKLLIGTFSGLLLAQYCPAQGERHPETMWLFLALTAAIAPVGLLMLSKVIRLKEAGREED